MCAAGQNDFMTNALLNAGLAELQRQCADASAPMALLSCTQSASFTSIAGAEVTLSRAVLLIVEVLNTWSPSVDRFVMLLNISDTHWVSDSVYFLSRSVTLYDSMGGPSRTKSLILSRLLLFSRHAELRRRVLLFETDVKNMKWTVDDEVNEPGQQDG
eukprot:TRINITY_DN6770_c0_g1_i1.p7 TRINITY_DN6770_c0_g1~~TRINITY_DN6770_c0_g1_i1.p7  ORF type:complete len:158 (+),score=38.20 TRINITY_DN6770_c0_g1_i1:2505-2978(+)